MCFLDKLFGKKDKGISLSNNELMEAGACPNCWGMQEYQDEFRQFTLDQTKANINNDKRHQKAFVQQFIETNVTGIRLQKDGDYLSCPKCKSRHKLVSK